MLVALLAAQIQALSLGACVDGTLVSCTLSGCPLARRECVDGRFGPCECIIQTCDDGNPCTTDVLVGSTCSHTRLPAGSSCNDSNFCTTGDHCDAAGYCVGTSVAVDDGNPCTLDRCDAATGAITHTQAVSTADCSSGTYFCYDKYGDVTRKIVCVSGVACDTSCP